MKPTGGGASKTVLAQVTDKRFFSRENKIVQMTTENLKEIYLIKEILILNEFKQKHEILICSVVKGKKVKTICLWRLLITQVFQIPVLTFWLLTPGQSRLVNTWGMNLNNTCEFPKHVLQSCCSHNFRTQNCSYTGTGALIVIPSAFWKLPNWTVTNIFIDDATGSKLQNKKSPQ